MGEGLIVRRGVKAEVIEKAETPTINFVSSTTTSITFTIKNNDAQSAVILWEQNDTTPDANSLELAAGVTSSDLTISGLTEGTLLTIYATANVTNKIKSNVAELEQGITLATPTITQVSTTPSSITFTVRNESNIAVDVTYGLTSPPTTTTLSLNATTTSENQTITGLTQNTEFTVFAQAKKAGYTNSAITSSEVVTGSEFTIATGGTTTEYNSGGKRYKSHTFTSNGTFTVTVVGDSFEDRNKVDYLIIAGGGASGTGSFFSAQRKGGGGGAGGYRTTLGTSGGNSTAESKVTLTVQDYEVIIGASTSNSSALGITSTAGGVGGSWTGTQGGNGGSGGGGGTDAFDGTGGGGTGIAGQGTDGLASSPNTPARGGGAGGATGLGNILRTGSSETRGAPGPATGGAGAANTGNGAGGPGNGDSNPGGSGIVIIRYEIAPSV
jgi:hypothetical protein